MEARRVQGVWGGREVPALQPLGPAGPWAEAQLRLPGMDLVDPDIFNRDPRDHYDLLQRLGGGTYGEVFKVRSPLLLHHSPTSGLCEAQEGRG